MKKIISMFLAAIMILSTVSLPVFAEETEETNATVDIVSEQEQELCIGKEVEYGSDLYSIKEDGLYVSKNYGRDTLMDEGTVTWVIERDGVLYWSKLDEYNTDINRMNLSGDSKTTLVRLFVPVEAFDVVGDNVYYLYNGEITILNILTNEESSMGMYDCEGFYVDDDGSINLCKLSCTKELHEVELLHSTLDYSHTASYGGLVLPLKAYLPGSYFTDNGGACKEHVTGVSSNCHYFDGATQCLGFARYVQYSLFGFYFAYFKENKDKVDLIESVYGNGSTDAEKKTNYLKDIFADVKLGAHIRTIRGHSLIFMDSNETNMWFYDCNNDYQCGVRIRKDTWEGWYNYFFGAGIDFIATPKPEYYHTHSFNTNGRCISCGDTFMGDDGTHYYGKDIVSGFKGEIGIYKKSGSGGVDAYTAPNMNSIYQKEITTKAEKKVSTETVHVIDIVANNNGTLNFKVKYGDYENFVNRNKFLEKYKRSADLPSTITFEGMREIPASLNHGEGFGLWGTIRSNYALTKIVGSIVRANDDYVVLKETDSGGASYNIRPNRINEHLTFNTLSPDTYYLKYEVWDRNNGHEVWTSSNFKVGNVGTVPTLRAGDITGGKKIDISCSDKNAIIKYTVDGGKEQSISAGGSKTIEFKTAGNHTVVAWSVSGTTVSTKGTQSVKIEKAWLPTIIDWFKRKAGYLADIDVEYGNTSAQVIISGEGDLYYTLNGSNPTTSSAKYTGPVEIKNSCTVKAISVQQGYAPSDVATKDIIIREPDAPSIQLSNTKQKIAQGKTATVSWSKVNYATKYVAYLYYNGECVDTYETTGTSASFKLPEVGKYTINVKAHNFVGYSPESNSVSVMSMAPVTVTIVDQVIREGEVTDDVVGQIQQNINEHDGEDAITVEGNVISVQKIDYDSLPARPMTPSKKGFTFAGYGEGMYTPATEDKTIYALYEVNYYTVEFWNYWTSDSTTLASSQDIIYTFAATPPTDFDVPTGYALAGWNVDSKVSECYDFSYVEGDMKLYTSYTWENMDLPVVLEILSAKRGNTCQSYDITLRYINNNLKDTQARIIMTLYTADGKVVYTATEDVDLMARDPGKYYTETIQATYPDKVSKISAVMVQVKNDMTAGAVSRMVSTTNIEMPNADTYWDKWSGWSTTAPSSEPAYKNDVKGVERQIETKKQYRYRNKNYTSSGSSSLSGWTHYNTTKAWGSTVGPVYYNPANGARNVWSESYVTSSNYKTVYHYYRYANSRLGGYGASYNAYPNYYTYDFDYELPRQSGKTWTYTYNYGSDWNSVWRCDYIGKPYTTQQWVSNNYGTRWYYQDPIYTYYFWQWQGWSSWSDSWHSGEETQERTLYRYRDKFNCYEGYDPSRDSSLEEATVKTYDISGNVEGLEGDFNGKLATVMVYKKTNTDPTQEQLQYVEQITLGVGNSYSFTVNPKEEIDYAKTGDYIVTLAIEGCDKLVNIDVIKAPVPTYEIKFFTADGVQYGETQNVEYGGGVDVNAIGIPEKDGYRFVKWDKSVVNVTKNISVNAIFEAEKYPIVFVDHENETTEIQDIAYGEPVVTPTVENVEGKTFVGWEGLSEDGETLVEGSAIYTALWESEIYTVTFLDFEGNTVGEVQDVEYGEAAELPECVVVDGVTYPWDTNSEEWWNVTHDMTISPYKYTAREIAAPAVDVESGTYDEYLLVNLSADDEATIYYSEYEITEEDMERFVEMQENSDNVSLLADEGTTSNGETSSDAEENDYSYLTEIIVEYDEAIPVTGSTVIYAFTVKDGKMSSISTFEYDVNDFVPEEEEIVVDDDVEQITLPTITVKPGEEVSVPVTIKNNPGLNNLSIVLGYDTEKFTLISTDNGDVFADNEYTEELKDDGSCKFTWASATDNSNDGILVTLTFKAAENIEEGEYNIVFTDTVATDSTEEEKYLVLVDGTIVNSATVVGDVNGDEDIDFSDAILILKHDVGLTTLPSDKLPAGDVNGDGDVDFSDAILILKLDAGLITSFN